MSFRFAAVFVALALLTGAAAAKQQIRHFADATPATPSGKSAGEASGKEPATGLAAARERRNRCIAEWRNMSASEKANAGPKWPQFFNKCVKRQKGPKS